MIELRKDPGCFKLSLIDDFLHNLFNACKNIRQEYYEIEVYNLEKPVYRERVYCYELYHQLRLLLGDNNPYVLHGELDKSGHPVIHGRDKPDFLFHVPGDMLNFLIMEVKPIDVSSEKLGRDLDKIKRFQKKGYLFGIMLLFGKNKASFPENLREIIKKKGINSEIKVIWHYAVGVKPDLMALNNRY